MGTALTKRLTAAARAAMLALACACAGPKHPSNPGAIDEICQPLCAKRQGCDPADEFGSCMSTCRHYGSPRRIYWRADHIADIQACIGRTACGPDMARTLQRSCYRETHASMKPTILAETYCKKAVEKDRICGTTTLFDKCVEGNKVFTDPILTQKIDCLDDHPCKSYGGCLVAVVGPDEYAEDSDRNAEWRRQPVPKAPPTTSRFAGTIKIANEVAVERANVCVHDQPEIPCVTTDSAGHFSFDLPVNRELAVTVRGEGLASTVFGVSTTTRDLTDSSLSLEKAETVAARYAAFGVKYPDDDRGFVLVRDEVQGADGAGIDGLTMSMLPSTGKGPFYFEANSNPSPTRTSTSTWSVAAFAGVASGVVEIVLGPGSVTCVPSKIAWAAQAVNRVRVPVLKGYETHVRMRCNR
jgi:hypothetical protein